MITANSEATPMVRVPRSASPVPTRQRLRDVRMPVPVFMASVALLVPALILVSVQLGWFGATGRIDAATGQAIELTSESVGDDIRGWMTLDQVIEGFALDRTQLNAAFPELVGVDSALKMGEISEAAGIELDAVRAWIDARLSPEVPTSTQSPSAAAEATTHAPAGDPAGEGDGVPPSIRGRTTVAELLDASGATLAEFAQAFNLDAAIATDTRMVDLVDRTGVAVAVDDVRTWVETLG